jgi:hypothetical protein
MRSALIITLILSAAPLAAQTGQPARPDDKAVEDVITTPLSDVNLQKKEISPILLEILDDPYSLEGIRRCRDVIAAVTELNTALGPDFDTPVEETRGTKRRNSAVAIASGAIGSLIPFRFLIREISGANKAERDFQAAIYAGVVRRGFLKGYGKHRRCKAPGSPMAL